MNLCKYCTFPESLRKALLGSGIHRTLRACEQPPRTVRWILRFALFSVYSLEGVLGIVAEHLQATA